MAMICMVKPRKVNGTERDNTTSLCEADDSKESAAYVGNSLGIHEPFIYACFDTNLETEAVGPTLALLGSYGLSLWYIHVRNVHGM